MSSQFFIARNGKKHGPYSEEKIAKNIKAGKLLASDLVWQSGMKSWVQLSTITQFKFLFDKEKNVKKKNESEKEKFIQKIKDEEVDLKKYNFSEMLQVSRHEVARGPYPVAAIIYGLQQGTVLETDYVWANGLPNWVMIKDVEVFQKCANISVGDYSSINFGVLDETKNVFTEKLIKNKRRQFIGSSAKSLLLYSFIAAGFFPFLYLNCNNLFRKSITTDQIDEFFTKNLKGLTMEKVAKIIGKPDSIEKQNYGFTKWSYTFFIKDNVSGKKHSLYLTFSSNSTNKDTKCVEYTLNAAGY